MNDHVLRGLDGSDPLGFLAALGILAALDEHRPGELRLAWPQTEGLVPKIIAPFDREELVGLLSVDPTKLRWLTELKYLKLEKKGPKPFGGCAPPVGVFRAWLDDAIASHPEALPLLSSICCPTPGVEIDEKKLVSATMYKQHQILFDHPLDRAAHQGHFDFTSRNAQFLDQAQKIGEAVTSDRVRDELFLGRLDADRTKKIRRLRWDPYSGRPGALSDGGTRPTCPVQEWFAFRSLALLPCVPTQREPRMTACIGRRKSGRFVWPLWEASISLVAVRAVMTLSLAESWSLSERRARSIRDVFSAALTKSADGYDGTFSPSEPVSPGKRPRLR